MRLVALIIMILIKRGKCWQTIGAFESRFIDPDQTRPLAPVPGARDNANYSHYHPPSLSLGLPGSTAGQPIEEVRTVLQILIITLREGIEPFLITAH